MFNTIKITDEGEDYLQTVFKDGEILKEYRFSDIKSRTRDYTGHTVD